MKVYCTYCSKKKDKAPGLLPAIDRYKDDRIIGVHRKAKSNNVELFILSGKFGFIHSDTKIPWYDLLLETNQVPVIVDRLKWQLASYGVTELTWYTELPEDNSKLKPYNCAIEQACQANRVKFEKRFWAK